MNWLKNFNGKAESSRIPERLYAKADRNLPPLLYSKWDMEHVIEGTGRKPNDVDPSISLTELLKIAQKRAVGR